VTRKTACHSLVRALADMLPDADIRVVHQQRWHSQRVAATQIRLSIEVSGNRYVSIAQRFSEALPDHEFALREQLVAEIAVTDRLAAATSIKLTVDALLFDD
jgi:hypothetical protein